MVDHASTVDTYNYSCPAEGTLPTMSQLQQGMGVSGTAWLYVSSVLVCSVNCAMFLILVRKFIREVPERQVPNLCWVTSLFTAISFFTCLMIFLPRSTEFLLGAYRVYEAMVIGRFVELNLMWYGGEKQLVNNVGENAFMRFNLPPCCCCLLCLRNKLLTRKRVKHVRLVVGQMIYIQVFVLFLQLVLQSNDIHDGPLSPANPHTYVKFVGRISFLFGFWGLFVFFKIEHTFKLLDGFRYIEKFTVMKLILILFILQETIIEGLASAGIISCIPHLSGLARGFIINCCMVMVESFILGVVSFYLYFRYPVVKNQVKSLSEEEVEMKA
eukprot:GFUD01016831.1.p1 GENE.GFUD01016831.1~~GFUD01016831.1.p1  ORF type:complete len:327 (-),score=84.16 GFUD01016831.1:50-1030(-)